MQLETEQTTWLDRPLFAAVPQIKIESLLITVILILAVFSRLFMLGERVMSHDEVNHVVPSFSLYQGQGYQHDPVTHGPFQFHMIALSYFLFGDNDFSSRLPHALFSIATVFLAWFLFRRYFGRAGGLLAALFFLISPFALFYGRYARNEAFVGLYALLMLFSLLRYLESGQHRYLYLFTLSVVMHVITKETAYIYIAQALLFLGGLFLIHLLQRPWIKPGYGWVALPLVLLAIGLVGFGMGYRVFVEHNQEQTEQTAATEAAPQPTATDTTVTTTTPVSKLAIGLGLVAGVAGLVFIILGYGWAAMRQDRAFSLLLLLGTLILPQLAPLPLHELGVNVPVNAAQVAAIDMAQILQVGGMILLLTLVSIVVGRLWNWRVWATNAALFYTIFAVFYMTLFTHGAGFVTGLVGSLGYWLSQQEVQRGSQPLYYYALVQIPMYEYLAALGTLLAGGLAIGWVLRQSDSFNRRNSQPVQREADLDETAAAEADLVDVDRPELGAMETGVIDDWTEPGADAFEPEPGIPLELESNNKPSQVTLVALLLFWAVTSLAAYTVAGERMPWLTYHIAIPMLLSAAWSFGFLIDRIDWRGLFAQRGWLLALVIVIFMLAFSGMGRGLFGSTLPFQGVTTEQLQATSQFSFSLVAWLASLAALYWLLRGWSGRQFFGLLGLMLAGLLTVLTARTAIRANFINYDSAKEFLVYAHAARGPKDILEQVEEISRRTTGGQDISVAYDNEGLYPYWWYFRSYPNKKFFGGEPTRDLRNSPVVLVTEDNYQKAEPLLQDDFYQFDYMRLWWPMQDYYDLDGKRIQEALFNPDLRAGLFDIWFNADYTRYAAATGSTTLSETTWQPSRRIRMYVRKDIAAQIWNYGVAPVPVEPDPYEQGTIQLEADRVLGTDTAGTEPGQYNSPRQMAFAPDGSFYVADSRNHRIQHFAADGTFLQAWGTFGAVTEDQNPPAGAFNEPWGVAVGLDGSVYVSDTWNNRIQKFTAEGVFVKMWGYFGPGDQFDAFWGPRGLAVDALGRLYVADTGNKRIVIFDADGNGLGSFGKEGFAPGEFSEPVAVAFDAEGNLYVTDTWNARVQVFFPDADGLNYFPLRQWDIQGWFGESLENKPFITVDGQGFLYVTDPEGYRVLQFDREGQFVRAWGDVGNTPASFGLPSGIVADPTGGIWVTDAGNHRLLHFTLP